MNKKKILIITNSRSDFGILYNLIKHLKINNKFFIKVLASGTHFAKEHGKTIKELNKKKISSNYKILLNYSKDSIENNINNFSIILKEFSKILKTNKFDAVLLLGDRYETFAFSIVTSFNNLPLIHLHGGELTLGSQDDMMRHAITKLSHLHFVTTESYKKRVIQLGENPKSVFNFGSIANEVIHKYDFLNKKDIEKKLGFSFRNKNILITYHPETLKENTYEDLIQLLKAVHCLDDYLIIFTRSNADFKNDQFTKEINKFIKKKNNCFFFNSLGFINYFSVLKNIDLVIGNSSSGIIEVPSFKIPTINIGDRQSGRVKAKSVIDCRPICEEILKCIKKIANNKNITRIYNPYFKKDTTLNIIRQLENTNLNELLTKNFYNYQK